MVRRLPWAGLLVLCGCAATSGPARIYRQQVPADEQVRAISLRLTAVDGFDLVATGTDLWRASLTTNVPALEPTLRQTAVLSITQKLPLGRTLPPEAETRWQAEIGTGQPLKLDVVAASLPGAWQLSGLPLTGLSLAVGEASPALRFERSNPADLGEMTIRAGVGPVALIGLGHAGPGRLTVEGGRGAMRLDFTGSLRRTARAELKAGLGPCTLVLPAGTPVRLRVGQGVDGLQLPADYRQHDGVYLSPAYVADRPHWDLHLQAATGTVVRVEAP